MLSWNNEIVKLLSWDKSLQTYSLSSQDNTIVSLYILAALGVCGFDTGMFLGWNKLSQVCHLIHVFPWLCVHSYLWSKCTYEMRRKTKSNDKQAYSQFRQLISLLSLDYNPQKNSNGGPNLTFKWIPPWTDESDNLISWEITFKSNWTNICIYLVPSIKYWDKL